MSCRSDPASYRSSIKAHSSAARPATLRVAVLAHGRELERENAPELTLGARTLGEKSIGAIDEHAAKLEGSRGKPSRNHRSLRTPAVPGGGLE
jgi:hypothetical protein